MSDREETPVVDKNHSGPFGPGPYPVHVQAIAVMADGGVLTWELPVGLQDEGTIESVVTDHVLEGPWPDTRARPVVAREVELTFRVRYTGDLQERDADGEMYRSGAFGDALKAGKNAGRDIPDYQVARLAQIIGSWTPSGVPRDSEYWAKAVLAQATLTGQQLWSEAFVAGISYARQHENFRPRYVLPDVSAAQLTGMRHQMPLFGEDGKPTWLPGACPQCKGPVETITAAGGERDEGGRRPVVIVPCNHRAFACDPVQVTIQ